MNLARLFRGFEQLAAMLAAIAALMILAMSLWITYDVLARYFFDVASPWSFDLSEYALVWITYLAAPWVLLRDRHVRVEILTDALPIGWQRAFGIAVSGLAMLICAVLAWRTGMAAVEYYQNNVMMPRIWRIPRIWPYCVVPVGSALLTVALAIRLHLYMTSADPEGELSRRASAGQSAGRDTRPIDADEG